MKTSVAMALGAIFVAIAFSSSVLAEQPHEPSDYDRFTSGGSVFDDVVELKATVAKNSEAISDIQSQVKKKVDPGTSGSTMKIVGRVHADAWSFPESDAMIDSLEGPDGPQTRLGFRRIRFGVRGDLPANMTYRIEMEFAGGNNIEFRDVWLGWKDLFLLNQLLIGNQKRPYGLDHLNSSRYNVFIERPFIVESFNQDARRLGVQSWGVSDDQRYNWRFGIFNQRLIQDEGNYISDHLQGEIAGRFAHTVWYDDASDGRSYIHLAISGTSAYPDGSTPSDTNRTGPLANEAQFRTRPEARTGNRWLDTGKIVGADNYQLVGAEAVMNFGPFQTVAEYMNVWMERDPGTGPDLHFNGGYVYVSYFLTGEHIPWSRKSGTLGRVKPFEEFFLVKTCDGGVCRGLGAWQLAVRWSYADLNSDNVLGGVGESVTLGLNWHWTSNARMQFNYINGTIENAGGVSGDYDILGARFMVDF